MTKRSDFTFRVLFRAFALATLGLLTTIATTPAAAQTFNVLYKFTGGADGANPYGGVTVGGPGTLYGTTSFGGNGGQLGSGTVYELSRRGSGWVLNPLHEFSDNGSDGYRPNAAVAIGANGALYGTTAFGGSAGGGTVFELQPPATACKTPICYWNETLLHAFQGGANDGWENYVIDGNMDGGYANLTLDQAGDIYSTTAAGGSSNLGVVFELTPSGGGWTIDILHSFSNNGTEGYQPLFGVIFDPAGNLYGTTEYGTTDEDGGTVFALSPSSGTWTEDILYTGFGFGNFPSTLIRDQSGNLYSTTWIGDDFGNIFELTPSNGSWTFSLLHNFFNDCLPQPVVMDAAGNLYGTCELGGRYLDGMVFELTYSGGSWTLTDLHDFSGGDGYYPLGPVVLDSSGNLYGTATRGGNLSDCVEFDYEGCGVVWEISGLADRH
ncbi:MAG: choice-of-anchor tandem repeat GloVer-containing protein [Candidatus Korobacteraceae bacterium]